ncbi:hypothetical protein GOV14_04740 [Candidatus Pacearchaeota archaeon]|nr:hypothetical protein [Candidatus Pacearchaeota archaeon]
MKSKRGTENWSMDTFPFWMIFAIILAFTAIFFIWVIAPFAVKIAIIPEGVETHIISQRFWNSPDCFAYKDETSGRVYQKLLDYNKFTEDQIKTCYKTDDVNIQAFRLSFSIPGQGEKRIQTTNWRDSYLMERTSKEIFVRYNNQVYKTKLSIEIQNA